MNERSNTNNIPLSPAQLFLPGLEPERQHDSQSSHQSPFADPDIQEIREAVARELTCSAHGFDHIKRVYNLCMEIAKGQDIDLQVLQAAALLHDIARVKEDEDPSCETDHALLGAEMAILILQKLGFPQEKTRKIQDCILSHRFRTPLRPQSREAQILFDADTLDGIGAIGIARSLVWIGRNNARIFEKLDISEYVRENMGGRIDGRVREKTRHNLYVEYQTKVKALKARLYTKKARDMASGRLRYYGNYLRRLEKEILGHV